MTPRAGLARPELREPLGEGSSLPGKPKRRLGVGLGVGLVDEGRGQTVLTVLVVGARGGQGPPQSQRLALAHARPLGVAEVGRAGFPCTSASFW